MAGQTNTEPFLHSGEPFKYSAPAGPAQTSPHKLEKISNSDARKHGDYVKDNVALDRPLLGASSMGHTILIDFETFENDILGVKPSLAAVEALPDKLVNHARLVFDAVFGAAGTPTEAAIAEQFIKVLNAKSYGGLLNEHKAAFTGNHSSDDGTASKVDAGLYLNEDVPVTISSSGGKPDWNRIRLFVEFKRESTSLDPFDDYEPDAPEASAQSRQAVRHQITDYALVIRNCEHRTCIYGLFVIGPEFRLMRFDQSGIIVTKKKNYAQDPRPLLSFLAWFDKLLPEQQGYDPTATLLKEGSRAYKLMDEFSKEQPSDMPYAEGSIVPATYTPPQPRAQAATVESARSPYNTRQKAKAAVTTLSNDDESYLDEIEVDDEDPRVFKYVREKFHDSLEKGWPRYRLEVGEEKRIFLVGKPLWTASWLFGRGTRGYIAIDVKKRRFAFLKDCWRPFYEGLAAEGSYLKLLNPEGAPATGIRVPVLVAHGDVAGQVTLTPQYANYQAARAKHEQQLAAQNDEQPSSSTCHSDGAIRSIPHIASVSPENLTSEVEAEESHSQDDSEVVYRHFTHYRIAVKDICLPFTEITSSKQLVELLYDCVKTHSLAYTQHQLLHRDVSAGNVIILPSLSSLKDAKEKKVVTWKGVLTDWELAKKVPVRNASDSDKPQEVATQPERTGTWQFMSVAYVRNHPHWPVSVADELESFFHVLLFYAVRLLRHNIGNIPMFVAQYFDGFVADARAQRKCSPLKSMAMDHGIISGDDGRLLEFRYKEGNPHGELNKLISSLLRLFKARYAVLHWESYRSSTGSALLANTRPEPAAIESDPSEPSNDRLDDEEDIETEVPIPTDEQPAEEEPSEMIKTLANQLDSHAAFRKTLANAVNPKRKPFPPIWPNNDVVKDSMPDHYDARLLVAAFNQMYTASAVPTTDADPNGAPPRKKMRTDVSEPSGPLVPQPQRARTVAYNIVISFDNCAPQIRSFVTSPIRDESSLLLHPVAPRREYASMLIAIALTLSSAYLAISFHPSA
ncbi:hypothetical protein ACG7TL_007895 [Trametes sanguinea]